jgi:hypothetical protein
MRTGIFAVLIIVIATGPAVGQTQIHPRGEGTDFFRAVLNSVRANPLSGHEALRVKPTAKVLIVFGDTSQLDLLIDAGDFQRFIRAGGSVLIATDRPTSAAFDAVTGIRVSGEFVEAEAANSYRTEFVECPIVVDHFGKAARHPIFAPLHNPSTVATNRPSFISHNSGGTRSLGAILPIAWLPVEGTYNIAGRTGKSPLVLAVANTFPTNHLLVIADHSIFINDMMWQGDNDNITFAFSVVRWLTDNGQRTEVLFIDDGTVQTDFNVSLSFPPPQLPPLVPLADEIVVGLERENAFNKTLLEMAGGPGPILRTIAFLLTLALVFFGLYRFLQGRHRQESRVPRLPGRLALSAAVPAVERRHQAVIAQGNLAEAARELAHQAFAAIGLTPTAEAPPPAVSVVGGWPFRARRWRREVSDLWTLAARGPVRRISPNALRRLDITLHNLLAAVAAGKVRLAAADSAI